MSIRVGGDVTPPGRRAEGEDVAPETRGGGVPSPRSARHPGVRL